MSARIRSGKKALSKRRLEPRKKPVQARSRVTVEDIQAAAAQVFEEVGYAAGTTNRIAVRAGVSIGTLYQYFPSKDALAVALLERHFAQGMSLLREWVGQVIAEPRGLRETLRLFVEGMLTLHSESPRLQRVILEEATLPPRVHEAVLAGGREAVKMARGLLRLCPEVRHPKLDDAAVLVVQAVQSLTHQLAAHPELSLPRAVFATELTSMLEAYLTQGGLRDGEDNEELLRGSPS